MNNLIQGIELVKARASELNCTVSAIVGNVILCHRGDNSYITWRARICGGQVEFISGCYDMTRKAGHANLIERANDG